MAATGSMSSSRPERILVIKLSALGHIGKLRRAGFTRVYDLQRSQRTGWYFRLLGPRPPEWVGSVPGCSHRYIDPPDAGHITVRNARMLAPAGVADVPPPDLS